MMEDKCAGANVGPLMGRGEKVFRLCGLRGPIATAPDAYK